MTHNPIKRVGISIDDWKLDIFNDQLTKDGFIYEKHDGLTAGTLLLIVETDKVDQLATSVQRAQLRAHKRKLN